MARVTKSKDEERFLEGEIYLGDGFTIDLPEDKDERIKQFIKEYDIVEVLNITDYDEILKSNDYSERMKEIVMNSKLLSPYIKEEFLKL